MESPVPPLPEQIEHKNNGLAIAAGWLGIGAIVSIIIGIAVNLAASGIGGICAGLGALAGLVGFILGIIGLVQINKNPGQQGKGMAITGIVIGALGICLVPVAIAFLATLGPVIGNVFSGINNSLAH
jgi:FtsH-binding integral membrane protein